MSCVSDEELALKNLAFESHYVGCPVHAMDSTDNNTKHALTQFRLKLSEPSYHFNISSVYFGDHTLIYELYELSLLCFFFSSFLYEQVLEVRWTFYEVLHLVQMVWENQS